MDLQKMSANVTILGSGSALPTFQNTPACQLLSLCDKDFMIDCGEGAQLTLRKMKIRTARLYNIFISHLHGDHCFGLIGLISTFDLMKRTQPLHIYAYKDLRGLLLPQLNYYCPELNYELIFHDMVPNRHQVIFEDRTVRVETIPLRHKVPCCGFLFIEQHRHIDPGTGVKTVLHRKRYAYCSDTLYNKKIIPIIEGVDTLFHETTYTEEFRDKCNMTMHSTAKQAAILARDAKVGKLIMGHFSSRVDDHEQFLKEGREVFPNIVLAKEQTTIEI